MTEPEHNNDSVHIYRKDENGNLYIPKSKKLQSLSLDARARLQRIVQKRYKTFKTSTGSTTSGTGSTSGGSGGGAGGGGY